MLEARAQVTRLAACVPSLSQGAGNEEREASKHEQGWGKGKVRGIWGRLSSVTFLQYQTVEYLSTAGSETLRSFS
jgi:hypothetical protein